MDKPQDPETPRYTGLNEVDTVLEKLVDVTAHTTSYDYDPNGNPTTLTHDGAVTTYEYDPRDLIAKVTNTGPRVTS